MINNQDNNAININVDEYHFDIDDIKNGVGNHCIKCDKKFTSIHSLAMCRSCIRNYTINQTTVLKDYGLNKDDLEDIDYYPCANVFRSYTNYYILKEIRLIAILIRFDLYDEIDDIDLETYTKCVGTILQETREREEQRKQRKIKIWEEKTRKKKMAYDKRKNALEIALAAKNLVIRNDSYYCEKYLKGEEFDLEDVVNMMEIMNFFATKTLYFVLCDEYSEEKHKEYGTHFLAEDDKDEIKRSALKKYLKKNSADDVPEIVMKWYS